jgi:hypothetical protein
MINLCEKRSLKFVFIAGVIEAMGTAARKQSVGGPKMASSNHVTLLANQQWSLSWPNSSYIRLWIRVLVLTMI